MQDGWPVGRYIGVEINPLARDVSDAMGPVMDRCLGNEVHLIQKTDIDKLEEVDGIAATPECQAFSHRNPDAAGFEDEEGSATFVKCAQVYGWLTAKFPRARRYFETTQVSRHRGTEWQQGQMLEQQRLVPVDPFSLKHATKFGSAANRSRRLSANVVQWHPRCASPAHLRLNIPYFPRKDPTECIVATVNTEDPVMVSTREGLERKLDIEEAEKLAGCGTDFTTEFGKLEIALSARWRMIGNTVCYAHNHAMTQDMTVEAVPQRKVVGVNVLEKHPEQIELHMMDMSQADRRQYVTDRRDGWDPPELDFKISGIDYHCHKVFPVEAKNSKAVRAKAQMSVDKGQFAWKDASEYDAESCYSPAFWKMKDSICICICICMF
jgi:hypothetical protein